MEWVQGGWAAWQARRWVGKRVGGWGVAARGQWLPLARALSARAVQHLRPHRVRNDPGFGYHLLAGLDILLLGAVCLAELRAGGGGEREARGTGGAGCWLLPACAGRWLLPACPHAQAGAGTRAPVSQLTSSAWEARSGSHLQTYSQSVELEEPSKQVSCSRQALSRASTLPESASQSAALPQQLPCTGLPIHSCGDQARRR